MTVDDYRFYEDYLKRLKDYYDANVIIMTIRQRIGICKEIERTEKLLDV